MFCIKTTIYFQIKWYNLRLSTKEQVKSLEIQILRRYLKWYLFFLIQIFQLVLMVVVKEQVISNLKQYKICIMGKKYIDKQINRYSPQRLQRSKFAEHVSIIIPILNWLCWLRRGWKMRHKILWLSSRCL